MTKEEMYRLKMQQERNALDAQRCKENSVTPETAPVGSRILVTGRHLPNYPIEFTVVEWSPSGFYVVLRSMGETETCWARASLWELLEVLPLLSPEKQSVIAKACDKPDEEWERLAAMVNKQ